MPEKKSTGRKATAPDAHVAPPAATAVPATGEAKPGDPVAPAASGEPDAKPPAAKSAAVRMMTRSIAVKKPAAVRGEAQRVVDAAKPSQKPGAGGGRRGPRRGASKGR
jgi:hypothetical protein